MTATTDTPVVIDSWRLADGPALRELFLACDHASHRERSALGWMPRLAYRQRHARRNLAGLWRNNDLVGWVMWSITWGELRILQIWVRPDARMIEHGRALIEHVKEKAQAAHCFRLRCWVAEDLPANVFWRALGFRRLAWRWGKSGRRHNLWTLWPAGLSRPRPKTLPLPPPGGALSHSLELPS